MALKLKIEMPSGVSAEYFRAERLHVNPAESIVEASFSGFVNKAARLAGKAPVAGAEVRYTFLGDDYKALTAENEFPTKAQIYQAAKSVPGPLQEAVDA